MTETIIGTSAFVIACLALAAYVIWRAKNKPVTPQPETWIHKGEAPKGADIALRVIKEQFPDWTGRYGGTIEWVKGPFMLGHILAAGGVVDFNEPYIKLMYDADITKTAIAHEVFHVHEMWYGGNKILDGNPLLYAWVYETNKKIRAAMA